MSSLLFSHHQERDDFRVSWHLILFGMFMYTYLAVRIYPCSGLRNVVLLPMYFFQLLLGCNCALCNTKPQNILNKSASPSTHRMHINFCPHVCGLIAHITLLVATVGGHLNNFLIICNRSNYCCFFTSCLIYIENLLVYGAMPQQSRDAFYWAFKN